MKPDSGHDDGLDTMRALNRVAAERLDERPDPSVRAAVIAAAHRAVDAGPRRIGAVPSRRWPWSAAAVLVVSVLVGIVAVQTLRDPPEHTTTVARNETIASEARSASDSQAMSMPSQAPSAPMAAPSPRETTPATVHAKPFPAEVARHRASPEQRPPAAKAAIEAPSIEAQSQPVPNSVTGEPAPMAAATPNVAQALQGPARARADRLADAAAAPRSSARAMAPNAVARGVRPEDPQDPEAWLARILKLRDAGDDFAADREIEALRRRYPDFVIPASAFGGTGTR